MQTEMPPQEPALTESISKEIINPSIDMSIDYAELSLDEIFDDGILKEIPIIKTLYSLSKIGLNIKERAFTKKLLTFLKEFHNNNIEQQKLLEFKNKFNNDVKYRNKVTEHIMVFTDTFLSIEKPKILANIFKAYIEGHFDWTHFVHLSTCLNSLHPKAFSFLEVLSKNNFRISEEPSERFIERNGENEALLYACGIAYETSSWSSGFNVSQLGKDLVT